jgi:uncharacterized damage-inducible protein DinB
MQSVLITIIMTISLTINNVNTSSTINNKTMKTVAERVNGYNSERPNSEIDNQLFTEFLLWGDQKIINLIKNLSEDEFNHSFGELVGSVHGKTAHILSIYEFFNGILIDKPYDAFPDLSYLTQKELISKWELYLIEWPKLVTKTNENQLFALPLAGNQQVEAKHIFTDAAFHTIHHRGQILTFIRLLGKNKEDVNPRDTNMDYLMFVFAERNEIIRPAAK